MHGDAAIGQAAHSLPRGVKVLQNGTPSQGIPHGEFRCGSTYVVFRPEPSCQIRHIVQEKIFDEFPLTQNLTPDWLDCLKSDPAQRLPEGRWLYHFGSGARLQADQIAIIRVDLFLSPSRNRNQSVSARSFFMIGNIDESLGNAKAENNQRRKVRQDGFLLPKLRDVLVANGLQEAVYHPQTQDINFFLRRAPSLLSYLLAI